MMAWWLGVALAWPLLGEGARPTNRAVAASDVFAVETLPGGAVQTDPAALGRVARQTAAAIRACTRPMRCKQAGLFGELGVDVDQVLRTLDLVATVAEEDATSGASRLTDPAWIEANFVAYRWSPDTKAAAARKVSVTSDAIRLTKYLVYQVSGSPVRTETYDTALYRAGTDGSWTRYTRIDAYAGVFEEGGAAHGTVTPLVYLTREGVNRALMQGTVEVTLPDGKKKLYNVHKNNGIAWNPSIRDGNLQKRYWTFQEQSGISGVEGVRLEPGATVAGDIHNVGFGKLIALHDGQTLRLVVLADTGGAFQPNLFQLDWLAGSFPSHEAYERGVSHLPKRTEASVLVAR